MSRFHAIVAFVSFLAGGGLPTAAWLFFRRPGVSVWTWTAPLWRSGEYLTDTGVVLWIAGLPAMTLGAFLVLMATRSGPFSTEDLECETDPDTP